MPTIDSAAPTRDAMHLCDAHKLKAVYFCSRCRLQLCSAGECLTNHIGHPLGPPSESILAFTNEARGTLTESSAESRAIRQRRADMKQLKKEVKKTVDEQQSLISTAIAKAIEELQVRERELIRSIKSEAEAALDQIDGELDHIESSEENLASLSMSIRALSEESGLISKNHWTTLTELQQSMQSAKLQTSRASLALQLPRYDPEAIQKPLFDLSASIALLKPSIALLASNASSPAPSNVEPLVLAPEPHALSDMMASMNAYRAPLPSVEEHKREISDDLFNLAPLPPAPTSETFAPSSSIPSFSSSNSSDHSLSLSPPSMPLVEDLPIIPQASSAPALLINLLDSDPIPIQPLDESSPILAPQPSSSAPALVSISDPSENSDASSAPEASSSAPEVDDYALKLHEGTVINWTQEHKWQVWNADASLQSTSIPPFLEEHASDPVVCCAQHPGYPSSVFIAWKSGEVAIIDMQTRHKLHSFMLPPFEDSVSSIQALVVNDPESTGNPAFVLIDQYTRTVTAYTKNGSPIVKHTFPAFITSFAACHGHLVVATADGFIKRQELFGKLVVQTWQAHQKAITSMICVPGPPKEDASKELTYYIISAAYDGTMAAWALLNAKLVWVFSTAMSVSVLCAPEFRLKTGHHNQEKSSVFAEVSVDGTTTIREVWQGTALYTLPLPGTRVSCAYMDNDYILITGGAQDPRIHVWNWRSGRMEVRSLVGHLQAVYWLKLYKAPMVKGTSQLHCISHSADAFIEWNVNEGTKLSTHPTGQRPMYSIWTSSM